MIEFKLPFNTLINLLIIVFFVIGLFFLGKHKARLYFYDRSDEIKNGLKEIVDIFSQNETLHIILSPEGQLAKTNHWKKGFYYMAKNANVPIIVGYIDYKKKEIGLKGMNL